MKKTITIIAMLLTFVSRAQLTIDSVTPTRLCPGDSITFYYTCQSPGTYQFNLDGQNHDQIWSVNIQNLGKSSVKFKTADWWNGGTALASCNWINTFPVEFCERVGITESEIEPGVTTYKQVYGNIYVKMKKGEKPVKVIFYE